MATQANQQTDQEGAEEEVQGDIEAVDETQGEGAPEQTETIRLSRRKREQQERDDRMAALEADRTARTEEAARLRAELQQTREAQARMQGALEQISQRQAQPRETGPAEEPIDARIKKALKLANAALSKPQADLDEYQEHMLSVMELKAQAIVEQRERARPAPQQAPQRVDKPAWVTAIEFQYPDVLTHPRGQQTVIAYEPLVEGNFSPEKLHRMFTAARTHLGLGAPAATTAARPATQAARSLHTGITSTGTGPRRPAAAGDTEVKIPKKNLEEMMRAGLTRTQAAKAWRESYGDEG